MISFFAVGVLSSGVDLCLLKHDQIVLRNSEVQAVYIRRSPAMKLLACLVLVFPEPVLGGMPPLMRLHCTPRDPCQFL